MRGINISQFMFIEFSLETEGWESLEDSWFVTGLVQEED